MSSSSKHRERTKPKSENVEFDPEILYRSLFAFACDEKSELYFSVREKPVSLTALPLRGAVGTFDSFGILLGRELGGAADIYKHMHFMGEDLDGLSSYIGSSSS